MASRGRSASPSLPPPHCPLSCAAATSCVGTDLVGKVGLRLDEPVLEPVAAVRRTGMMKACEGSRPVTKKVCSSQRRP